MMVGIQEIEHPRIFVRIIVEYEHIIQIVKPISREL